MRGGREQQRFFRVTAGTMHGGADDPLTHLESVGWIRRQHRAAGVHPRRERRLAFDLVGAATLQNVGEVQVRRRHADAQSARRESWLGAVDKLERSPRVA